MARTAAPRIGPRSSGAARRDPVRNTSSPLATLGTLAPVSLAAILSCGRPHAPTVSDSGARAPSGSTGGESDGRAGPASNTLGLSTASADALAAAPVDLGDASDPEAVCARVRHLAFPPADEPSAAARGALAGCDAEALYDGLGGPPDDANARACAYVQLATESGEVFGGAAILTMIYANGRGVPDRRDLALHFACMIDGAPAELAGRVDHLLHFDPRSDAGAAFDVCDDVTSGFMEGHCRAREERRASVARDVRKRAAERNLPPQEMAALDRAAETFFDAREKNEVDLSGTARAALQVEERARLEDAFVAALERLGDRSFVPNPGGLARADAELNAVFQAMVSGDAGGSPVLGTVTAAGVRATERAWIPYRDAWVALARKARPDVRAEVWAAWLTRERTEMLRSL